MKANEVYQAYSCDADDETARRLYFAKYGKQPAKVLRRKNIVLVGPIGDEIREE